MSKQTVELTRTELFAAWVACSNYIPAPGEKWKQAAQAKAADKIFRALARANKEAGVEFTI